MIFMISCIAKLLLVRFSYVARNHNDLYKKKCYTYYYYYWMIFIKTNLNRSMASLYIVPKKFFSLWERFSFCCYVDLIKHFCWNWSIFHCYTLISPKIGLLISLLFLIIIYSEFIHYAEGTFSTFCGFEQIYIFDIPYCYRWLILWKYLYRYKCIISWYFVRIQSMLVNILMFIEK